MTIDIFTSTGAKKGTMELPSVFEARINEGLMHQALLRQQSNRRHPIAHAKSRGEVVGTTKKLFQQKGTGRARRGAARSPLLRGGGKAFGPKSIANFQKDMPRTMRRTALASCLSFLAKNNRILALESYPETMKTKAFADLLKKLPVEMGRRIVIVIPESQKGLELSARNVAGVKTILVSYLNPEDLLTARSVIFLTSAIEKTQLMLTGGKRGSKVDAAEDAGEEKKEKKAVKVKKEKKEVVKKPKAEKKTSNPSTAIRAGKSA